MPAHVALLQQNALCAGAAFALIATLILLSTRVFLRLYALLLRSRLLASYQISDAGLRRSANRGTALLLTLLALLAAGGALLATRRGVQLGTLLYGRVAKLSLSDWGELGMAALRPLIILALVAVVSRLLVKFVHYLRARVQQADVLSSHREPLMDALDDMRAALSATLLFGTALLCVRLWALPDAVARSLSAVAYVIVALYVSRFVVRAAHTAIDVTFDLAEAAGTIEHPLRHVSRLKHLRPLTKRAADYLLYVGIATWTVEQITPDSWAGRVGHTAIRIIAIFYLCRVLIEVCLLFLHEFFLHSGQHSAAQKQQRQTLVPVAASILRYLIYFMAVVMSLREAGLDPTPLLAGAGVAGIAVGLGAQSFVGDLVAGFFVLFENLIFVGDLVEVGEVKGKVEEIGIRVTKIRDDAGVLHILPNSEVRKIANHSSGYINVIVDLPIPYGEDLHRIFDLLTQKMASVRESHPDIMDSTELAIEELREGSLLLRSVTMVKPGTSEEMGEVVRLAFWEVLNTARIAAPYARHMLLPSPTGEPTATSPSTRPERVHRSDIQKLKAYNLYLALDVDDNGYLEQADVDALARRLVASASHPPTREAQAALEQSLRNYWREITQFCDRNADGRVSREEFLQFCSSLSEDLAGPGGDAVAALAEVLFVTYDRNRNGTLSESEFVAFTRAHGLLDAVASAGFRLIDRDRNGHISQEEWMRFMRDLFVSRKLNDASAVVFGPGCRDRVTAS